jgi:hypothetical protein
MGKKSQEAVAKSVFGSDRDRDDEDDHLDDDGDDSVAKKGEGEGDPSADADPSKRKKSELPDDKGDKDDEDEDDGDDESDEERTVPLKALKAERRKNKERKSQDEMRFSDLQAKLNEQAQTIARLEGRVSATPQPQRRAAPPPTFERNPQGFVQHQVMTVAQEQENRILHISESSAKRHYGKEKVEAAKAAAKQLGILGEFRREADPYDALMEWHQEHTTQETLKTAGGLEGLKKSIREELRKELEEEARKKGGSGNVTDFPDTLARRTRAGTQGGFDSGQAVAKDIFGSDRPRRRG